jgi:hypothetical protein
MALSTRGTAAIVQEADCPLPKSRSHLIPLRTACQDFVIIAGLSSAGKGLAAVQRNRSVVTSSPHFFRKATQSAENTRSR